MRRRIGRSVTLAVCVGVAIWLVGVNDTSQQLQAQTGGDHRPVTMAEYEHWKTDLSNWGRWGEDDQLGALNLVTPEKRRQAARLVIDGVTVSMAAVVNTDVAPDNPRPYEISTYVSSAGGGDRFAVQYHGYIHTHIDAFSHRFFDGKMWNGFSADKVTAATGAEMGSIYHLRHGIFTRGILMDIPRLRGVPYLDLDDRIYVEDLEAWERMAGVTVSAGDAVFIRTGRWVRRAEVGPWEVTSNSAGLDPSVIPWLRQRDVALLGSETAHDAHPPQPGAEVDRLALHDFALIMLGVHLFDNTNLDEVAAAAAARSRWEFLLTAAPLPFENTTGSPLNPIAVF